MLCGLCACHSCGTFVTERANRRSPVMSRTSTPYRRVNPLHTSLAVSVTSRVNPPPLLSLLSYWSCASACAEVVVSKCQNYHRSAATRNAPPRSIVMGTRPPFVCLSVCLSRACLDETRTQSSSMMNSYSSIVRFLRRCNKTPP